ncbi:MAG: alginate lyase family protein [Planctomycetes bacterium]|jgi:hypothetical protein|nr:alginate lyase family protein [Planctomycetota bacterium]
MSLPEIAWRSRQELRRLSERVLRAVGRHELSVTNVIIEDKDASAVSSHALGAHMGLGKDELAGHYSPCWRQAILTRVEKILSHRITLFDLADCDLGKEINWNYEYKAGVQTPLEASDAVDYRSYSVTGDCKFVWELNRHHHLVVLGRAYRVTGDLRFAVEIVKQIESWMRQSPFGHGMNWRSPLELGIRLINWVWALELIQPSGALSTAFLERLLRIVHLHMWEISRKYSHYSSANNHVIGEAAGVFIASSYFGNLRGSEKWRGLSQEILAREIEAQTYPDGGHREQAMGYQLFVMEFFLLAGLVARNTGNDFQESYWERLRMMFRFVSAHCEAGGSPTYFGDCDDGYVLELGGRGDAVKSLLDAGGRVLGDTGIAIEDSISERAFWLLGPDIEASEEGNGTYRDEVLRCHAFPDSGRYLIQCGRRGNADSISVEFDCGELGFGPLAAHGHADALSITLRVGGIDVLVDPGTYDYFSYPDWRDYFRSTEAHNTVVVDGANQSEILGPFLWGRRARSTCMDWSPEANGGKVIGRHDGYQKGRVPVIHEREVRVLGQVRRIHCLDRLRGQGMHRTAVMYHFSEDCDIVACSKTSYRVLVASLPVEIGLEFSEPAVLVSAEEGPGPGWLSRSYHRRTSVPCLRVFAEWINSIDVSTFISVGKQR